MQYDKRHVYLQIDACFRWVFKLQTNKHKPSLHLYPKRPVQWRHINTEAPQGQQQDQPSEQGQQQDQPSERSETR